MSSSGASATCTRKMRSLGMERIADRSVPRARVWKVSRIEPDGRMVGAAHDLPGVAVVVDVPAPGQRLVADRAARAAAARSPSSWKSAAARSMPPSALRRDVAADQQQVAAELLHQVELALGAVEAWRGAGSGMPSKSRNGWKVIDRQPEIGAPCRARRPACREGEEIVLEDLDALEPRGGDRLQLLVQRAAQRRRWRSRSSCLSTP